MVAGTRSWQWRCLNDSRLSDLQHILCSPSSLCVTLHFIAECHFWSGSNSDTPSNQLEFPVEWPLAPVAALSDWLFQKGREG